MSETATLPPGIESPPADDGNFYPAGAGDFYEIVNGRVVEPPPMGVYEVWIANVLSVAIDRHFTNTGHRGRAVIELLFRIQNQPNLQRRPDLAFVSYERWPKKRPLPKTAAWQVVPDLAVEVISPSELAVEVFEKLDDYFRAGVRQVWVVYPGHQRVFVHNGPKSVTVLDGSDTLDGGDILPGFRLGLADLFEDGDESGEDEDEQAGTEP